MKKYIKPKIIRYITITDTPEVLCSSVVDKTTIKSVGQEVETYDFSSGEFNHNWE